jgi:UDP-GlcNAc:undecaprenyl-phosphate/decaprenyl-phosphate GlcNAc-1-phosphate transferase
MNLFLFVASSAISFLLVNVTQKYYLKNKIIVRINDRSSHSSIATSNGGISIFITLFLIAIYNYINSNTLFNYSLLIPLSIMTVVGTYDDNKTVDFKLKFIFQIIVAKIIVDNGLTIDNLHGFFGIYELSSIISQSVTIFIIVGIINSINFIDGIDGLAISVILVFLISFEFFGLKISEFTNLTHIVVGSMIPLLFMNLRAKNKVFLGDGGSLFLGALVSIYTIFILSDNYIIDKRYDLNKILFVISILIYPFIDIVRVFILRISKNKSPFIADKNHIHHILLKIYKNHFLVTLSILGFSIFSIILFQILFN